MSQIPYPANRINAMTSSKRRKANAKNARRSTGPRTAAGKARSKMNALKHGLDAKTIILPGEDGAAFRSRLDAWWLDCPPRNPLEESLLRQAVELSWQLDRADRIQAAQLAERIASAEVDQAREQAEAEEVGKRLMAGQPAPVFDRPGANELLAGKRLCMPMRPDDPNHPALLLRRMESTVAGCLWLVDRWSELRTALEAHSSWQQAERLAAVHLLGKEPADAVDVPMVQSIYLCCFALDSNDPHVFDDQAEEMTRREFEYFLQRLAGRRVSELIPPTRDLARAALLALLDGVIVRLEARAAGHAARAEAAAASAPSRLAFDPSPQGERLRRLQGRLLRSLIRTFDLLTKLQSVPDAQIPRSNSAQDVAASPEFPAACANLRNEPNAPTAGRDRAETPEVMHAEADGPIPSPHAGGSSAQNVAVNPGEPMEYADVRNEPNVPVTGWDRGGASEVENTAADRGIPDPTAPESSPVSASSSARNVGASPGGPSSCADVRNEPNAAKTAADRGSVSEVEGAAADGPIRMAMVADPSPRSPIPVPRDSHLDPDLPVADLAAEPVHRVPPNGRTPAVGEAEPPVVQRADHLTLLDPAQPERAVGMRTAPEERDHLTAMAEDRDAQARGLAGHAPALPDILQPADRDPLGHRPAPLLDHEGNRKTTNL
jgi:hypothetical protein